MSTDCLRLDDYLDGRLSESDAETFETHTLACADCDAALDASLGIPDLAVLRDETCPPAVLQAALAQARRAPDRAAQPATRTSRGRVAVLAFALAGAIALALGLSLRDAPSAPTPIVADVVEPTPEVDPPAPEAAPLAPAVADVAPISDSAPPRIADALPRRLAAPAAPAPRPAPPDATVLPDDAIAQSDPEPTPEEIEDARRDLALAFALVAEAQTRAGEAVRAHAGPMTSAIDNALPF